MNILAAYLMGIIVGLLMGVSWGLGHATRWVSDGPSSGLVIAGVLMIATFGIAYFHSETK